MEVSASVICFVFHVMMLSNEDFFCVGGEGGGKKKEEEMRRNKVFWALFQSDLSDKFWMDA